jgi:hypothetical protein
MHHDARVQAMLADLSHASEIRKASSAGPALAARRALRRWQADRLSRSHADLLASPRYHRAAAFFLTDLYDPQELSTPYAEAARAMPIAVRLLPPSGLETVADAWRLDALTETLDAAMIAQLGSDAERLTVERYAVAYRLVDREADRIRQVDLIGALAISLQRFCAHRFAGATLAMMRRPARLTGFGTLQTFLSRGFEALHDMGDVGEFVAIVTTRERRLMDALMAGDASLLDWTQGVGTANKG